MWTSWTVIVLLSIVGVVGLGIYNIKSLISKWKANPDKWADLLVGIIIWCVAIAALTYLFLQQAQLIS